MSGPPLMSGPIALAAAKEIDAMISGLIPDGKKGAAILVVDKRGAGIGMAMKHGKHIVIEATLQQRWATEKPTAQIRVKSTW